MEDIDQIAIFVDIENVIGFCTELRLPIDLADVLEKLKEEGRITVRRSFGDISKAMRATEQGTNIDRVRRMLSDNLFLHEDIPYASPHKNSADMRLAVEALYIGFTLPNITKFAVVSGDSDYVPLFSKLKEQSKSVIGISGSQNLTSESYRRSCDRLFYFEDIFQRDAISAEAAQHAKIAVPVAEKPKVDYKTLRDEYAGLLVKAVESVEQSGKAPLANVLVGQMRQLQSDFDFERADFSSFRELLVYAQEKQLVALDARGQDIYVRLPSGDYAAGQVVSTAQYRKFVQDKLKVPLPNSRLRAEVFETAYEIIGYNADDTGGIMLQDLSYDVSDELSARNAAASQPTVYKLLYSLYRARCFQIETTEYGNFNPFITGINAQLADWDDKFISVLMRSVEDETTLRFYPANLSFLFYESDAQKAHIRQLLNRLGIKYEND